MDDRTKPSAPTSPPAGPFGIGTRGLAATALLWLVAACTPPGVGDPDDTAVPHIDGEEIFYDPDEILEVEILVDKEDWDALRNTSRNIMDELGEDCLDGPLESPYVYYPATVTIDGDTVENVGVSKKGLLGSESSTRPSLKIKLDEYEDQDLYGRERFTFNNARQDVTFLDQCLGYALFTEAGVPASRCNFAHVVVNGDDLGLYVNVEPIKKDFLRRHFTDDEGNLYEGALSDFREGWVDSFERKTNEDEGDRSDLDAVVEAVTADDDALLDALDTVFDLDAWYTYWAMEVLLGHWDGYASNTNNFYLYAEPSTGRFHFIPWGIDALFDDPWPFGESYPTSVVAWSTLPRRLYLHEEAQDRYLERLEELLATTWDEEAILAEVDRMEALVSPWIEEEDRESYEEGMATVRDFVETRRENIEAELAEGPPAWEWDLKAYPCMTDIGDIDATFDITWGDWDSEDIWHSGTAEFTLVLDGNIIPFLASYAGIGEYTDDEALLAILGAYNSTTYLMAQFLVPMTALEDGASVPIDWDEGKGYLYYYSEVETAGEWALAAYLYQGEVTFDEVDIEQGTPAAGTLTTDIWGSDEEEEE